MKAIKAIFKTFLLSLTIVAQVHFAFAQSTQGGIVPNGKATFLDQNGKPLTGGKVYFYTQGTTTPKTTYQDINLTIPNTNPVTLDAAGRALLWGAGVYRQQVYDKNNNLIWDVTTSPGGSSSTGPTATGDGDAVGTIKPWPGATAPNQYMFTYGQELSRTTYAPLFQAITSQQNVNCSSGSPTLTGLSNTDSFWIGMKVELACLSGGSSTVAFKTAFTVTLAANANATETITATFFMWGNGNASTTFNLPDYRGLIPMGNNIMGGVASSNISDTYFGSQSVNSVGGQGGNIGGSTTLLASNLPSHTHNSSTLTDPGHTHPEYFPTGGGGAAWYTGTTGTSATQLVPVNTASATTGITMSASTGVNASGTSTPFSIITPSKTINYIIKVTPDTAFSGTGVTSLGGMTGDIVCGANLTCSGNTISSNYTNIAITNDTTTNATVYPTWVTANTGNLPQKVSSTKMTFNPSNGQFSSTIFSASNNTTGGYQLQNSGGTNDAAFYEGPGGGLTFKMGTANIWALATNALGAVMDYNSSNANGLTFDTALMYWASATTDAGATDATVCRRTSNGQLLTGTGTLGTCLGTSGAQFKTALVPMAAGLSEIELLNLVNYRYREGYGDNGERIQYGMTAQDVAKVMPDLVRYDEKGDAINFDMGALLPVALRAIQQLKADNDDLRSCRENWKCRIFGWK